MTTTDDGVLSRSFSLPAPRQESLRNGQFAIPGARREPVRQVPLPGVSPVALRRAVVADRDAEIGTSVSRVLDRNGFSVRPVHTGADTLAMVRAVDPDLVILDLGLIDMDSVEVCRRIRAVSDCYVVMLAEHDSEVDRLLSLEVGADDFMAKPFSLRELQARVTAMFRRPRTRVLHPTQPLAAPAVPANQIDGGSGLAINVHARSVTIAGAPVALTRTEFDVLAHLIRHNGVVISRRDLMCAVWATEHVPDDTHLIDVHVANLRRKLKAHSTTKWITTVRGVGFRFDRD